MEKPVTVIARLKAKPGKEEALKETLLLFLDPSRKEEGCISYELHISDHDPGLFMFHEIWADNKALAKHLSTPQLRDFITVSEDLLAEPMDVSLWYKLDN